MTGPAFDRAIAALEARGHRVKRHGNYAHTWCTHPGADNPTGLSVFDNGSRIQFTCFTRGCTSDEVRESLGLTVPEMYHQPRGSDLAVYDYGNGRKVIRRANKAFTQRGNTPENRELFHRENVPAAVTGRHAVYLVEGEEDVLSIEALGGVAVSAPEGGGNVGLCDLTPLKGARVIAVVDRDVKGQQWAATLAEQLDGLAASVEFVHARTGKDASDHAAAGHGLGDFQPYHPPGAADGAQRLLDRMALDELRKLRARTLARELFDAERRPPRQPGDHGFLGDILARPPEPPERIEDLIPSDSNTLVAAIRKCGKTTYCANLTHSLLTGQDFLGRFGVRKLDGVVGMLNYEVSGAMLSTWAQARGIHPRGLWLENLRGKANPLADPELRGEMAERLRRIGVEALIVDVFGVACRNMVTNQNDPGEVRSWLAELDEFARSEVGATDLILTTHAGWNGERSRGSSALEDWPDTIITLTRAGTEASPGPDRFMRAMGRLGDVDEDRLDFDKATKRLTLSGDGGRQQAHKADTRRAILNTLADHPEGLSGNDLKKYSGQRGTDLTDERDRLVNLGQITAHRRPGRGGGILYSLPAPNMGEHGQNMGDCPPSEPRQHGLYRDHVAGSRFQEPLNGNNESAHLSEPDLWAADPSDTEDDVRQTYPDPSHTHMDAEPITQATACRNCGGPNHPDREAAGLVCLDCRSAESAYTAALAALDAEEVPA